MSESGYDHFAWLYHQHWDDFTDQVWPVIQGFVLPYAPKGSHIVDLCCGTGKMARRLLDAGYLVTGIDNSKEMLQWAHQQAGDATLLCQDAREFELNQPAQVIVSLFDSLNHMMHINDLQQVFSRVFDALVPGGLFFFDMNTVQKYESRWTSQNALIYPDHVAALSAHYDLKTRIASFDAAIFLKDQKAWIRRDVHLTQKAYAVNEIQQALINAGFPEAHVLDGVKDLSISDFYGRLFFWTQKVS
ncbi:class I SAM-dependent DNA methyltransferase [Sulfobacillus thermosulfidooxidans]|uniref:class I SAM-dependent DNA methyltransferase n=1 Tax=Sulfobacillus thermosulfidooxidans TaxID=28034 RepID=UPI0006B677AE|nr:class I SAM-dependent methyltransferase [Sulfobacillus thermosulfidooxidans]